MQGAGLRSWPTPALGPSFPDCAAALNANFLSCGSKQRVLGPLVQCGFKNKGVQVQCQSPVGEGMTYFGAWVRCLFKVTCTWLPENKHLQHFSISVKGHSLSLLWPSLFCSHFNGAQPAVLSPIKHLSKNLCTSLCSLHTKPHTSAHSQI